MMISPQGIFEDVFGGIKGEWGKVKLVLRYAMFYAVLFFTLVEVIRYFKG